MLSHSFFFAEYVVYGIHIMHQVPVQINQQHSMGPYNTAKVIAMKSLIGKYMVTNEDALILPKMSLHITLT